MSLTTRKPTGKPAWPMVLIAGTEKSGKSYACAAASASDLIDRTFWIGIGEDDPDEYGGIPGARFEIVAHDGTYRDLLRALDDINAELTTDGKPHMIVLDSASRLWDLLKDEAQETAHRRAKVKAQKYQKQAPDVDEIKPSMDLWNLAAQRWGHVMDALRSHAGPVLLTARLDEVAVMDAAGQPTREKEWKVSAHKSLPFDASAVVELRGYRNALVRGVRSLRWRVPPDALSPVKDFTVEALWTLMGLTDAADRSHHAVDAAASLDADAGTPKQRAWRLAVQVNKGDEEAALADLTAYATARDTTPAAATDNVWHDYLTGVPA